MSWLEQNKFLAGLIGVTAVGALGLGYVAIKNGSNLDELKMKLSEKKGELQLVEQGKAFPNAENKAAIEANAKQYEETLLELQDKMVAYSPSSDSAVTVADFQGLQNAYVDKLREVYSNVKTPENCRFGFDEYASKMAPQRATKTLSYQLEALEALFTELAAVSPSAILNVYRPLTKLERGDKSAVALTPQQQRQAKRRASESKPAYRSLSVELGVKLKEESLTELLEKLANHKEYYFVVRSLRVKNERSTSPNESELSFSKAESFATGGGGGLFFDAEFEDSDSDGNSEEEASAESETESSARILQQILGKESLDVHLKIDVLMFSSKEESVLPTLN